MSTWASLPFRVRNSGSAPEGSSIALSLAVAAGLAILVRTTRNLLQSNPDPDRKYNLPPNVIPSPRLTQLPSLTPTEVATLPYPPDVLPGARDVPTPYGTIHVFEWGPVDGEKVLLLHGISTPCLALGSVAEELVRRGYRVMLFDWFGRGWSDAPVPGLGLGGTEFDVRLYMTQILLVLASSPLPWTGNDGFHLVGYSLGGGVGAAFARWYPRMVKSLVVVAGGGLIRKDHVSWSSRILYSAGWLPEAFVRCKQKNEKHKNSDVNGGHGWDDSVLLASRPGYTVSSVMRWQLRHHEGFIPAFISSIRYAPIYEQTNDWCELGRLLAERREKKQRAVAVLEGSKWEDVGMEEEQELPGLRAGKILFVLGADDPVIVKEEVLHDATAVLGEDGFDAVILNCGHELVMSNGAQVAAVMDGFWKRM
ncbi:transcription factor regA-like protein [Thermochaetoides thermophila DSM 1495]|uniref:Transcription factor regA-like protein n=1 Tax=Chaetomium thermophilum (strain DSM 1495 / CBS 144.50 / IMI 039719) TaxID=759272 RepID=G0S1P2_CHATD|nr:transcription factor regA-like protein [Thermochaetoides thermophila DSM 1495]EGS22952.1 transcription factor regA-like protein [Thermochaetoides thermophila DSM 1495]